jgi:hypothetical protein
MSNTLIEKVINAGTSSGSGLGYGGTSVTGAQGTTANTGTGLLYPDQANRFIDYMWDATILAKAARTIRMRSNTTEIDKVSVGQRLLRAATEANPTDYTSLSGLNQDAQFSKVSLTTTKLRLDWELSSESLEDNIEGAALEDHIARLMATQAGNDIEDVLINGSVAGGVTGINMFNGWITQAKAGTSAVQGYNGSTVVSNGGYGISSKTFNKALSKMPRKYKQRRNELRFFAGSNLSQDYLFNLTGTNATPYDISSGIIRGDVAANNGGAGSVTPFAFGVPVISVPLMDETQLGTGYSAAGMNSATHGDLVLTFPQNFIVGIKRDVTVFREFKAKKDTVEYTLFIRVGCAIENLEAVVVVKDIKQGGATND